MEWHKQKPSSHNYFRVPISIIKWDIILCTDIIYSLMLIFIYPACLQPCRKPFKTKQSNNFPQYWKGENEEGQYILGRFSASTKKGYHRDERISNNLIGLFVSVFIGQIFPPRLVYCVCLCMGQQNIKYTKILSISICCIN